jgi:serine/threonine-protein kinase HipA
MGGARPKATIEDANTLWLGKFPARDDRFNMQRVEFATLDLARRCGLNVTQSRLQTVGASDVLMLRRFDRDYTEKGYLRLGFVSGLTVLDCGDSHLDRERWSYPLLADQLRRWSDKPEADCAELFKRMVFNAAVTNNDDHPRNHALLRTNKGWRLSPAYDLVPAPVVSVERRDLALTVGQYGRTASIYNLLSQSGRFGLSAHEARLQIDHLVDVVRHWRDSYFSCGVSARDIDYIAPAILPSCFFFEMPPHALNAR